MCSLSRYGRARQQDMCIVLGTKAGLPYNTGATVLACLAWYVWYGLLKDSTSDVHHYRASPQQSRGFFGGSKGTFTSFFSRTGHSAGASPAGDASIHGGAAGHFRQVITASKHASCVHCSCCQICTVALPAASCWVCLVFATAPWSEIDAGPGYTSLVLLVEYVVPCHHVLMLTGLTDVSAFPADPL